MFRSHHVLRHAVLATIAVVGFFASRAAADIVHLKDGTHIPNCQIVKVTESILYLKTPAGDMGVPRAKVAHFRKHQTAYDLYEEEIAKLHPKNTRGLYKLALWCRSRAELRKESVELAEKIFALNERHDGARRLLGHVKVGNRWYVPRPLLIQLDVHGAGSVSSVALRQHLEMFLETRGDVRVVPSIENEKPLDSILIDVSANVARTLGSSTFGVRTGTPHVSSTVSLGARQSWLGKRQPRTAVSGELPATVANASQLALQSAIGNGQAALHRFLDDVQAERARGIQKLLGEKLAKAKKTATRKINR